MLVLLTLAHARICFLQGCSNPSGQPPAAVQVPFTVVFQQTTVSNYLGLDLSFLCISYTGWRITHGETRRVNCRSPGVAIGVDFTYHWVGSATYDPEDVCEMRWYSAANVANQPFLTGADIEIFVPSQHQHATPADQTQLRTPPGEVGPYEVVGPGENALTAMLTCWKVGTGGAFPADGARRQLKPVSRLLLNIHRKQRRGLFVSDWPSIPGVPSVPDLPNPSVVTNSGGGQGCTEGHDSRSGSTSEERCLALFGCGYTAHNDHCFDKCTWEHDSRPGSTSAERCGSLNGCAYDAATDHCWAEESHHFRPTGLQLSDMPGWYDSDGSHYNCNWYDQHPFYCSWYGHGYRNFGHTANSACAGCWFRLHVSGRRSLDESSVLDKSGFMPSEGIVRGISREFGDSEAVIESPVNDPAIPIMSLNCETREWWNNAAAANRELCCNDGEAIGALFTSGHESHGPTYSTEKGYCCQVSSSSTCVWKTLDAHTLGDQTCDEGYVLNGLKIDEEGVQLKNVMKIKCCVQN